MSESTIGIKLANGTYYPILKEGVVSKKKLVLTTVKDEQESVQIDLYKGDGEEIEDAVYIGSLVIEEIEKAESGIPDIELVVGLDEEGNLHATANDEVTGDSQSLSVGIQTLDEQGIYEVPEFDMDIDDEDIKEPSIDSDEIDSDDSLEERYAEYTQVDDYSGKEVDERKPNILMTILLVLLGLAAIAFLIIILMRIFGGPDVPPLQAQNGQAVDEPDTMEQAAEEPVPVASETVSETESDKDIAETAEPEELEAQKPVEEQKTVVADDSAKSKEMASITGIWYKIKRGDTLWDLSSSFYENPWLFPDLANENDILNPDLIYEGNDLYIPNPRQ